MLSLLLFKQIAQMFLALFMGFALVRCGVLKSSDSKVLSRLALYVITPCVTINSYQIQFTADRLQGMLLALGAGQIGRIFILPRMAYAATVTISKVTYPVMQTPQFVYVVACLIHSAACCLTAGAVGVHRSRTLAAYTASLAGKAA